MPVVAAEQRDSRWQRVLVVVGIVVLAFNLRPAVGSIGPVLSEISAGLDMHGAQTSLLTSLPVVAFAVFGALTPRLARLLGTHRFTLLALGCVVVGLFARSRVHSSWSFLALSLLGLAGMAGANVLLPSLVKLHFPGRIGLMTAVYSTALAIGMTCSTMLTVPVSLAFGGWRSGLGLWSLTALVAMVPWLGLIAHDRAPEAAVRAIGIGDVARTRLGWTMAVFFGLQSAQAYSVFGWFAEVYRDAGFSAEHAGLLLALITAVSIPLSAVIPTVAGAVEDQRPLMWVLMACYPVGYLGLVFAPAAGAVVWALFIGVAACTFPLILALIGMRARTPEGTAALSGFSQSVGYLIAVIGPFGVGVLHDLSGGWTVPLLALTLLAVPQLVLGLRVSRPCAIEDELEDGRSRGAPAV